MTARITHLGTATTLWEIDGLRLLTDPVFDPKGSRYTLLRSRLLGEVTYSNRAGAALGADQVGPIDVVLLSHEQHDDNLDKAGRALLPSSGKVFTTESGAQRLRRGGLANATGLPPWSSASLQTPSGKRLRITATPARHGPPFTRWLTGDVIGFVLEWDGQKEGCVYISGDTVWFGGVRQVAQRFRVAKAVVHAGCAQFRGLRFTMNAKEVVRAARALAPAQIIPIHYDGWSHFKEGRPALEAEFASHGLRDRLRWLPAGEAVAL